MFEIRSDLAKTIEQVMSLIEQVMSTLSHHEARGESSYRMRSALPRMVDLTSGEECTCPHLRELPRTDVAASMP
jgi:hypothetical protein